MSRTNPNHHPRNRKHHNQTLDCDARECPRLRWQVSKYCARHARASMFFGNPLAHQLPGARVRPYQKLAAKWIAAYRSHETINAVVETVRQVVLTPIEESRRKPLKFNERHLLRREQIRLLNPPPFYRKGRNNTGKLHEVQPEPLGAEEATAIILGTWAVVYYFPELLPDDGDALTFALADQIFGSRQYGALYAWTGPTTRDRFRVRIPGALPRRLLGRRIRNALAEGAFLSHAVEAMEKFQAEETKKKEAKAAAKLTLMAARVG